MARPLYTSLLRAKELIFTGDRISPQQALEWGLANRVVAPDQLMSEARALAEKLLKQPRETKKIMNRYLHVSAAQHLDTTLARQLAATLSEEHHRIAADMIANRKRPK